jgi:hypothetical protein
MTSEQILSAALRSAWAQSCVPLRDCVAEITGHDYETQKDVMTLAVSHGFVGQRGLVNWAVVKKAKS